MFVSHAMCNVLARRFCNSIARNIVSILSQAIMKRARSVAARTVGAEDYKSCLKSWRQHRGLSCHAILVPSLVSEPRQVQPHCVLQLASLFDLLIAAGCKNAMFLPRKLEQALKEDWADGNSAGKLIALDLYAIQVSKHINVCFSMLCVIVF